ncbi:MAG: hypothetical protein ACOYJ2_01055 [Rickettsiales bacterium]
MSNSLPELETPPNAIMLLSDAFSGLVRYGQNKTMLNIFPPSADADTDIDDFTTFERDDRHSDKRRLHAKNTSGLPAIVSGLHMAMRGHARDINIKHSDALNEHLKQITLSVQPAAMQQYIEALETFAKSDLLSPETLALLQAHLEQVKQFAAASEWTFYDKAMLLRQSVSFYTACAISLEKESMAPHAQAMEKSLQVLFADLPNDFNNLDSLNLTLRDAEGQPIDVTVNNQLEDGKSLAGLIYITYAGRDGFLDTKKFPNIYRQLSSHMMGDTANINVAMNAARVNVLDALQQQHQLAEDEANKILCSSGFNISTVRWNSFFRTIHQNYHQAAFQEYVIRHSGTVHTDDVPLYQLRPVLDSLNSAMENVPSAIRLDPLVLPDSSSLVPKSRLDYCGLLNAISLRIEEGLGLKVKNGRPENLAKLNERIDELKAMLSPHTEASANNMLLDGYAQQPPSSREQATIDTMIADVRQFYTSNKTRDPSRFRDDNLDKLLAIAEREPDRGTRSFAG